MKTANRLLLLLCAVCLAACSAVRTTHQTIRGRYELRPDPAYYAGESIALRDGRFEASIFTDAMDDPRLRHFPLQGYYSLQGCLLTFHHPHVYEPHRLLIRRGGRFTMWTPPQYEEFLRTRRTPDSVLYQQKPR